VKALQKAEFASDSLSSRSVMASLKKTGEKKKRKRTGSKIQEKSVKTFSGSGEQQGDDVCVVCGEECDEGSSKLLLLCDGCDHAFHLQCVGESPHPPPYLSI
jgi:hypothetical protein